MTALTSLDSRSITSHVKCKKARVCILTSTHRALDPRIFYKEAVSLEKRGYEVHIFGNHPEDEMVKNVYIHAVHPPGRNLFGKLGASFRFFFRTFGEKADVYHFHDPDLLFCGLALQALGRQVIMDVHEDFRTTIIEKRKFFTKHVRYLISAIFDTIERISSKFFSGVIVVNEEMEKKFPNANVAVVRNFPITDEIQREDRNKEGVFSVIYTGRIGELRGCWQILEGFKLFSQRYNQAKLTVVGDFASHLVEKRFREKALEIPSIDVVGFLPWEAVRKKQYEEDVGLLISLFKRDSLEKSYPVKLFEYMAAGLAVIISYKHYWKQLLDQYRFGLMINNESPEEIADALFVLATNRALVREMGSNGRRCIEENFSWEAEFTKMNLMYESIRAQQ